MWNHIKLLHQSAHKITAQLLPPSPTEEQAVGVSGWSLLLLLAACPAKARSLMEDTPVASKLQEMSSLNRRSGLCAASPGLVLLFPIGEHEKQPGKASPLAQETRWLSEYLKSI